MTQLYSWDANKLEFTDKYNNTFILQLRGRITIITGSSASGKTLICNRIKNIQKDKNTCTQKYDSSNIFVVDDDNISKLSEQQYKLIIIDRAELTLSEKEVNIINSDTSNRYLIFMRKFIGIEATPNHYAELVRQGNKTTTQYAYNVRGWC